MLMRHMGHNLTGMEFNGIINECGMLFLFFFCYFFLSLFFMFVFFYENKDEEIQQSSLHSCATWATISLAWNLTI